MKQQLFSIGLSLSISVTLYASENKATMSQNDYIQKWASVAVENMKNYKIPASITLAQGSLESGNGNSPLAVQGNNHFGIKCSNWNGATIYFDDDSKGECFRKYASAADSYRDHSLFLTGKERYATLFTLDINDYKGWAKGLKKAGYATHPQYAEKLIDIIEKLKLYEYDSQVNTPANEKSGTEMLAEQSSQSDEDTAITQKTTRKKQMVYDKSSEKRIMASMKIDVAYLSTEAHVRNENKNKVAFVIARKGDTYYKISKEFDLALWQLYKYNCFEAQKDLLEEGDIVYLEPKRNKAKEKNASFVAKNTIQLCQISQAEGIKLKKLKKLNPTLSEQQTIQKGQKVLLR